MARQRNYGKEGKTTGNKEHKKFSNNRIHNMRTTELVEKWNNKVALFVAFNIVIVILSIVYFFYQHYLENIVITPLNLPSVVTKSGLNVPSRYWGTYRSGSYFGFRTRSASTLATGMMWFTQTRSHNKIDVRHWCDQWSNIKYSWLRHDGENFGVQRIEDKDYELVTSFVKQHGGKHGGDYTAKITVKPKASSTGVVPISLLFYVYTTSDSIPLIPNVVAEGHLQNVRGYLDTLGNFTVHFRELETSKTVLKYNFLSTEAQGMSTLKETVMRNLALFQSKERGQLQILGLIGHTGAFIKKPNQKTLQNFVVYQVTFVPPYEMEILFESGSFIERTGSLYGSIYDAILDRHIQRFEMTFEDIFKLSYKNYSAEERNVAQAALSNMIGGIGYFYGSSIVRSIHNKEPLSYWSAPLYTGVPSRSFFPRGFLWDEGFHNLLIQQWNPDITKDIIGHWLDLMNVEGWIPREQILGPEAKERVPREFIIQKNTNANPPTLFLSLESLLNKMKFGIIPNDVGFFQRALPRLKVWFNWFNRSQNGMMPGTYRWRGRDPNTNLELNPKTLTSGLDDFPRASHPTIDERHIDLRCWIAFSAGVVADIGDHIGEPLEKYRETQLFLSDNNLMDKLHWSTYSESYSDYGFHSRSVNLAQEKLPYVPGSPEPPRTITVRVVNEEPVLRYVDNFGYVSLFPFLLKIIDPENPKLNKILNDLKDPRLLWTNFGLRSLAKTSPYFMKYNTEHDPPYWRGTIWININYLSVRALKYYSTAIGPYKDKAKELYSLLRKNVVTNIIREYKRTGYIWEQYDDKTGHGKGVHPFTGWSALFVLIMSELY